MAQLPGDIILHIIARLPLKHAARCRILSKHFYNAISTQKFVRDHHALSSPSSSNPIIIHHSGTKFTAINSPSPKSITLADEDMILLDSCNGILLLHVNQSATYYIFNPFTGGVLMFLDYGAVRHPWWGLVVDMNPSSSTSSPPISSDFKLVDLQTKTTVACGRVYTRMEFRVFIPSGQSRLVMSEVDWDYEGSFAPMIGRNWQPVYGHGCVHWLGVGATAIVAFDVESERARIMDGPVREAIADCSAWFGFAQGSLQLISIDYSNREQISVHTHNCVTRVWRVAHRIRMPTDITGDGSLLPMFFDGLQKVFLHSRVGGNKTEEIYVHDLSVGKWDKRGQVDVLDHGLDQGYVEFVPTSARVYLSVHVSNMLAQPRSMKTGLCLLELQRLLLDHAYSS